MAQLTVAQICEHLVNGEVIAYPTEAVFGLGCDPDCESAILQVLKLKQRPIEKGLILIADNFSQLVPYVDENKITTEQKAKMFASWPGAVTWVLPKNVNALYCLTGKFDSIAVRVTDHPLVKQLCQQFGKPLVSTSANLSGLAPCRTVSEVEQQFGYHFPVLMGETGKRINPSEIRDIQTGNIIRQG